MYGNYHNKASLHINDSIIYPFNPTRAGGYSETRSYPFWNFLIEKFFFKLEKRKGTKRIKKAVKQQVFLCLFYFRAFLDWWCKSFFTFTYASNNKIFEAFIIFSSLIAFRQWTSNKNKTKARKQHENQNCENCTKDTNGEVWSLCLSSYWYWWSRKVKSEYANEDNLIWRQT